MAWPLTLLSLLSLLSLVSTEEPCTALTTTVSGDSTVVTIDCDDFIIIVTCAQDETMYDDVTMLRCLKKKLKTWELTMANMASIWEQKLEHPLT